jgi:naphthalene 1,2-dioxygenase system ferredoxin subunit
MSSTEWIDASADAGLPDGVGLGVSVAGREIALFRVGAAVYAIDDLCTHDHAALCDGFLVGHEVECPMHQARFDLRTGAATCAPATEAVRTYPVRIEGGRVRLSID